MKLASLEILASLNLTTEQMAGVVKVLAVELAPLEARRGRDRERLRTIREQERTMSDDGVGRHSDDAFSRVYNTNLTTTQIDPELIPPINPPVPSKPKGGAEHPAFERFWKEYPAREGNRDRKSAVKAFNAQVRRGIDPEAIIDGAFRYRVYLEQKGERTFVRQARTWLNADGWTETYDIPAPQGPKPSSITTGFDRLRANLAGCRAGDGPGGEIVEHIPRLLKSA